MCLCVVCVTLFCVCCWSVSVLPLAVVSRLLRERLTCSKPPCVPRRSCARRLRVPPPPEPGRWRTRHPTAPCWGRAHTEVTGSNVDPTCFLLQTAFHWDVGRDTDTCRHLRTERSDMVSWDGREEGSGVLGLSGGGRSHRRGIRED